MNLGQAKGHWALVTGASAGIGREFCHQLAAAGMNVAMVARRQTRLQELSDELAQTHGVKTLSIALDLSKPHAPAEVKARLDHEGIKLRLLCNNAGIGFIGRFEQQTLEAYEAMLRLNNAAMVALCWHMLPDLASHPTSAVINVSSQAAYFPMPFMAMYGATKAFVHSFSQALYGEWRERGVLVQTLVPCHTATEGSALFDQQTGVRGQPPAQVVQIALEHLAKCSPIATNVKGLYKQRLFGGIAPTKLIIDTVAKMWRAYADRTDHQGAPRDGA